MSLWLQLPEQGVLGIAKPSFVDRVALIAVFWSGRRELHRRPGPCQVARGIWEEKPVCVHPAKPEQSLQCCFGLLLPDNLLSMSLGGSLGPEPLSGDPETLLKGKESPKNLFLAFLNSWTLYRGVSYFPLRFPPQICWGGVCARVWPWGSRTLGYSDFVFPIWPLLPFLKPMMVLLEIME